jgi:uncharacterized repeat protein (TIGR02543 family)
MKGNGKRILSIFLAGVIAVTTVGYAPPFTSAASWKTNMEKALELLASPSEASKQELTATPSEAENPGREATPSEAEIPDGNATPSQAVKKFVRVEPEEIPEYYSQATASGKRLWKFEDRYGMMQYRDYGYVQGEAEFPLWYNVDLNGTVDNVSDSMNLDEEYYNLAPYIYKSVAPDQTAWKDLSWKIFSNIDEINDCTRKKISGFKNWNSSGYYIWYLASKGDEEEDLGYHFYGTVINEEGGEGQPSWYYCDENGIINNMKNQLMASLAAPSQFQDMEFTFFRNAYFGDANKSTNTYKGSNYNQNSSILLPQPSAPSPQADGSYTGEVFLGWTSWVNDTYAHDTGRGYSICYVLWANESTKVTTLNQLTNVFREHTYEGLWRKRSEGSIAFITDYGRSRNWDYQTSEETGYWTVNYLITDKKGNIYDFNSEYAKKPIGWDSSESHENETFVGWFTGMNGTGRRMDTYDYSGDLRVYAYFAPSYDTHTVKFVDDSGNVISEQNVPHRGAAKDPRDLGIDIPKPSGYVFVGWDYGGNNTELVTRDMVITAKYKNTNMITFDANGGHIYGDTKWSEEVIATDTLNDVYDKANKNGLREGYTLRGWNTKPDGTGANLPTGQRVSENTTYYAIWELNTYWIYYYPSIPDVNDYVTGQARKYQQPYGALREVSEVGYDFVGWFTAKAGGEKVTSETITGSSDVKLYGHWEKTYSNVTFHDGIPGSTWTKTINVWSGEKIYEKLPPYSNFKRLGWSCSGWYTQPEGKGESAFTSFVPKEPEVNLYLNWSSRSVVIRFILNKSSTDTSQWKYLNKRYDSVIGELPEANLDGKVFIGWFTERTGGELVTETSTTKAIDGNEAYPEWKLYAHWANPENIVTFKDWNGTIIVKRTVPYGDSAELPETPVRTGYRFIGWDKSYENIQADTVLTAQYEISSHSLTLDGNGGNLSGEPTLKMEVTAGDSLDQALADGKNNARRKYHTFTGWYTDPTAGGKYPESGNIMPDTDLTVYARWDRRSSEVTFKDWSGTVLERQEVLIGADATTPGVPERPGYTFTGWDKPTTNIQDHTEVTAQYSINGYLLTLNGNGGTLEESPKKEVVVSFDQSFDQILVDGKDQVKRPGYHFDGWYTSASGGSSYSYSGNQMPSMNVTVFAHWSVNTYKVTFDPNHEGWIGGVIKENHDFDTEMGILPAPEIYGWKFTGWWTGKNGSGSRITEQTTVESKDMVYYGNWEPVTYQVRFISKVEQPEGESVQTFTVSQTYDQVFKNLPEPVEKGYTFTGWYDEGNKKLNPESIFKPDSGAEGDTYHAGWKANPYKIKFVYFDADGKQVSIEMNQEYPSRLGTLPTPEKPGYTFIGWFKDNGEEVTAGSWIEAGDVEYKARWKANQYTIHFERNLPESETMEDPEDKTVTYTLPIGVLPYLNETGYVFLGWFTEPEEGSRVRETTLAALGDQTYYGHWAIGIIDNGNGTYQRPGADGKWNTADDELWWKGLDGISQNSDDKQIFTFVNGTGYYVDNGNGTHYRPGASGNWISGIELWWNGPDGIPGTDDDIRIYNGGNGSSGTPIYYIDSGNGIYIRPGASGDWTSGTEYWWYGPDGKPGTFDDRQIHIIPGGSGYYIDNGDGTYIKPGTGGSWTSGTEHWWYGPDGKPGTSDDRQIHIISGVSGYYIDNGDGTFIKPGTGGSWTSGTEHWWYGPDGKPGTSDDKQIHIIPGGSGYYIDNGDGTYIKPGTGGSWTSGTEHWWYGPDGKPGTSDDKQIHIIPGGNGTYIDNGDGTHIRPEEGGSWDNGTEIWQNGPDGKPGTPDDYKKVENTDPEPTKPDPTDPEPTDPEPTKPDPVKPEPTNPSKPEPSSETNAGNENNKEVVTTPVIPSIDSTSKPSVRDDGGTFKVDQENPKDVTYIKPDGTPASNEWVGDGTNLYHVNEESKLSYSWFLEAEKEKTWFMLNNEPGEQFGAALRGWYSDPKDTKKYFFDPSTTKMLIGWQRIDNKTYYFAEKNERQTYFGDNKTGWEVNLEILTKPLGVMDRPFGCMYRKEYTPDGYWVDENGVCADKK